MAKQPQSSSPYSFMIFPAIMATVVWAQCEDHPKETSTRPGEAPVKKDETRIFFTLSLTDQNDRKLCLLSRLSLLSKFNREDNQSYVGLGSIYQYPPNSRHEYRDRVFSTIFFPEDREARNELIGKITKAVKAFIEDSAKNMVAAQKSELHPQLAEIKNIANTMKLAKG